MDQFKDLYPSLTHLGLTSQHLLAIVDDSDNGFDVEAFHVSTPKVTNQTILEMHNFMNRTQSCTYYILWRWISCLFSEQFKGEKFPTVKSIRQNVLRLCAKLNTLKKMSSSDEKSAAITEFLNQPYTLPQVFISHGKAFVSSSDESSCSQCSSCSELRTIVKESKQKMYAAHRNGQKKVKRRDNLIKQQGQQIKEDKKVIDEFQKQATKTNERIKTLKTRVDSLRHRASYWKSKYVESSDTSNEELAKAQREYCEKQVLLQEDIRQLECDNIGLKDKVQDILMESSSKIATFQGGKYTNDIRACCYELLSLNVSVSNVKAVIESVLTNIAHKEAERLPKRTAVCEMMLECLTIAQAQIGEQLSHDDGEHYTLQTDGTTKHGQHFSTFDIATVGETYSLGLRHVFSGSAQNTLDTLLEILDDLDVVRKEIGESCVSSKICSKLKNTMSDRHSAEKLFSTLLSEYRATILPDVVSGWDRMTDSEREQVTRMNNFYCGLHFLVGLADSADRRDAKIVGGCTC